MYTAQPKGLIPLELDKNNPLRQKLILTVSWEMPVQFRKRSETLKSSSGIFGSKPENSG